MNHVKTRNLLILWHLFLASFLAPAFLMVAITGALDLLDVEAETTNTEIILPTNVAIDTDSPTIEQYIKKLLVKQNVDVEFESLRVRDDRITTRPTSIDFVRFIKSEDGIWSANLIEPDLQYSMMELHKGHGPELFRIYEIAAGIALFLVIIGGLVVGLMAKAYRRKTIIASSIGTGAFLLLGFMI